MDGIPQAQFNPQALRSYPDYSLDAMRDYPGYTTLDALRGC